MAVKFSRCGWKFGLTKTKFNTLRFRFLFYRDMDDEKVREALENVDNLLTEAQATFQRELFLICTGQALAKIDVLQEFDLIDDETAHAYINRVNGMIALYRLGLLSSKPATARAQKPVKSKVSAKC
jgi:hypothetical protein